LDQAGAAADQKVSWYNGDCYDVLFGVGKSRRYHAMMRDFYRRCADAVTAITALSGTSAFVALFLEDRTTLVAKILIGLIAAASTLNLVFGFAKKADLHDKLCRQFTALAAEMATLPPVEENRRAICAKRLLIEVDEPTERRVIDLRAHRDEERSHGVPFDCQLPLTFLQQRTWFGYFFDFGLAEVQRRLAERANN
jgi:hypothetical protein